MTLLTEQGASHPVGVSRKRKTPTREFFARVIRSKVNAACLIFLGFLVVLAVGAPWIAPYDPNFLGSDQRGGDTLSRLIWATQISLIAPVIAVSVAAITGIPFGLLAGYLGGKFDWIAGRIADAFIALPALILALAIIAIFGPGLVNAMLAVGIAMAPALFRVVRGATLAVREETYIDASKIVGGSTFRILFAHVLPNVRSPLLVMLSIMLSLCLLAEAGLSFLGLGVQPPTASWGSMLRVAFDNRFQGPWMIVAPGVAITMTILALNMLGDGIRDAVGAERGRA